MSTDVSVTDPRIYEERDVLMEALAEYGGEEVVEGLYSFATRREAELFHGALTVVMPGALVTVGDIDELIPPDEVLVLDRKRCPTDHKNKCYPWCGCRCPVCVRTGDPVPA